MTVRINDPASIRARAQVLINKKPFTKEDKAEFDALMGLLYHVELDKRHLDGRRNSTGREMYYDDPEHRPAFARYLRDGDKDRYSDTLQKITERRDMSVGTDASGGYFVPDGFAGDVKLAMKAYDRLFDPAVVTIVESAYGNQWAYPLADDTSSSATIVSEDAQDTETDPQISGLVLAKAPTWRSGIIKLSMELAQDAGFDIDQFLTKAAGVRLARGIGAQNVATLIAAITSAGTIAGSSSNTGGAETGATSIGTDDLTTLMSSVDPAYLNSKSCGWLMNYSSLIKIFAMKDKQGRPIIKPQYDEDGNLLLLAKPVFISPSMDSLGTGKKPIAFGNLSYFVVRIVRGSLTISIFRERYIDFGQIAYRALLRTNGGLAAPNSSLPVRYLQCP